MYCIIIDIQYLYCRLTLHTISSDGCLIAERFGMKYLVFFIFAFIVFKVYFYTRCVQGIILS